MGLGKWIVGGIVAAVAAPFVLPAAAVTAVGGAVAAGVGAVTAGAAAVAAGAATVGGAIAGLGASALAAASAIGATTLIGGVTIGSVLAWGGGLFVLAGITGAMLDDAKTEGEKDGYRKASREFEAKLRSQAKEFFTQIARLEDEIKSLRLQRDKAQALVKEAFTLLGNFEGCIKKTREEGREVQDETLGYYKQLKDYTDQALSKAA